MSNVAAQSTPLGAKPDEKGYILNGANTRQSWL